MEGEMRKEEPLTSSNTVIPYSDDQLDRLSPEVWHDLKARVTALLDDSVPYSSKKSTAEQLYQLFERLQHQSVMSDDLKVVSVVEPDLQLMCRPADHYNVDRAENQISLHRCTHEFNNRLRSKIAEFNEGLAHLGNKIAKLKTRLLLWNDRPALETDFADVDTCRNVNRNFRRILQKESRYLRDQLYAARETVNRLERRSRGTSSNLHSESCDSNDGLVPYELGFRPTDFINIESGTPQLCFISPIKSLQAADAQPRLALMKRSAPPLEVIAGPDVKSGKFICSLESAPSNTSSSSLIEWTPNEISQLTHSIKNEYQTEDKQYNTILA